jgi:pyrroline-5-carboxylate reductase
MSNPTIGVLGTGDFASYFIAALRNGGYAGRIILSPHSLGKAERLGREQGCEIAPSNRHLLAEADWVLVSVRPEQLDKALATLVFRADQIILSAVAGTSVTDLRLRMSGVETVVRIMPSSDIESTPQGLIPLFPIVSEVGPVLSRAGTVVAFENEEHFDLATAAACMSGWLYRFADELSAWFVSNGLSPDQARLLATGNIAGAMSHARANPHRSLESISDGIATQGTYTKLGLDVLHEGDFMKPWVKALDRVFDKIAAKR